MNSFNPFEFASSFKNEHFQPIPPGLLDCLKQLIEVSENLNKKYMGTDLISNIINQFASAGPPTELTQSDSQVRVKVDLPGLNTNDNISVKIEGNILYLEGSYTRSQDTVGTHQVFSNLREGNFSKIVPIPASVTAEEATATYRNGVLEIVIPKKQNTAAKSVKVEFP